MAVIAVVTLTVDTTLEVVCLCELSFENRNDVFLGKVVIKDLAIQLRRTIVQIQMIY